MYKKRNVLWYVFAVLIVSVFLVPFAVMIIRSLMTYEEIYDFPKLLPSTFAIENYVNFTESEIPELLNWFKNTLLVAVLCILGTLISAFLCAYGFAKVHFKFKSAIFALTMASTMLPNMTMRIPLYILYSDLGWLEGTLKPLVVPAYFGGGALNILLIIQFIKGIPNSVLESAKIDGANEVNCLFRIVLPNCLPIAIFICVNTFLAIWNDYSSALTYLSNSREKWTLALGLYNYAKVEKLIENKQMAIGVLMCIPSMLLFGFFQRSLIEGVAISGVKA